MGRLADDTFLREEHLMLREQVRRFVTDKIKPQVDKWEKEKTFPRDLYKEFGAAGFLGVGFPEEYGGSGGDVMHAVILTEELTRSGSPGLAASLGSLAIAIPPIVNAGTEDQKQRWLPKVLSGEWISSLAVTEPGTGSDVAAIRTRAKKQGDEFVINGTKIFITSGTRADLVTVVVRTGGEGVGGISVIVVETDRPGFSVGRNMDKMGWHASDTAELIFEDVRVPADNLLGELNQGFIVLMQNFAGERLMLAAQAVEIAQLAFEEAIKYGQDRVVFGRPINKFQVNRHKLAEMATGIDVCRTYVYALASRVAAGEVLVKEVAMAKNAAVDMAEKVVDQAVQMHGGFGYMREFLVERLYRDIRLYHIGGGTREIMNGVIAKQLGI
ncbi:MAG: acyl-CoA dehydrogenase family protein [Deltaproteobacteria bacterium]|nr:acyl-CoA dehydrogenase family protein [Deltaproteobacteria bacterium]